MDSEALEYYLGETSRRKPASPGAFSGSAGGAPCGDLIRISVELGDGRIGAVSFDAEGCALAAPPPRRPPRWSRGSSVLEAALLGGDRIAATLGGLGPQGRHAAELAADALHRALGAAASGRAALAAPPPAGERVLVALSGGVDCAVAALLERERGAEVVAVTLKLWADHAHRRRASCCSPHAVLGARDVAHALGIPHLTLDLEDAFRARVVERVPRRLRGRGRPRTRASSATASCGSTR